VVRTWGRETNRSTSCQLSKRTGGGKELEGRSAIGVSVRMSVRRSAESGAAAGYRFARWSAVRAGGRGTVLPVGRLYEPQPVAVRATAPARPRAGVGAMPRDASGPDSVENPVHVQHFPRPARRSLPPPFP